LWVETRFGWLKFREEERGNPQCRKRNASNGNAKFIINRVAGFINPS
jgi:hypothetical protein